MNVFLSMLSRNIKLFFKDKGRFFTSLITPAILLILYVTFLGNVYKNGRRSSLPQGVELSEKLVNGFSGGQIVSSILSVSCVTVAFCSNFLRVQDKANGTKKDFSISPAKPWILSLSYYFATLVSSLLICVTAYLICLAYLGLVGFYRSAADVFLLLLDVFLLSLFGTAFSSVINFFLSTQGQIAAVGTIVSAGYGFICGAYRPIASFESDARKNRAGFLPSVYGTVLTRIHSSDGVRRAREKEGIPSEVLSRIEDSIDYNFYLFGNKTSVSACYLVRILTILALILLFVLLNVLSFKRKHKPLKKSL